MVFATAVLTLLSLLLWIGKRECSSKSLPPCMRVPTTELEVSGNAIGFGKFGAPKKLHTLVTATLFHGSRSHLFNNYLMVWGVCEMEETIGTTAFFLLFFACGAMGWLVTQCWLWCQRYNAWTDGIAQFQTSIGSSPATYGICAAASWIMKDFPIATTLGLRPSIWLSLMLFAPKFCGDRFTVNLLVQPSKTSLKAVVVAIFVVSCTYLSKDAWFLTSITAEAWFLYYLTGNYVLGFVRQRVNNEIVGDTTDHACHFGGAVCGLTYALCVTMYLGDESMVELVGQRKHLGLSMLYLFYRMVRS
jgi:membrane associated rhomboid family serine protease